MNANADPEPHAPSTAEPIAVVGIACRFPGTADSVEGLWTMLLEGRDALAEVPPARWPIDAWYDADRDAPGRMNMRCASFLNQPINRFDAAFFGIAPREAAAMDPQQRLLLEVAWEALENAGCTPDRLAGSACGVFVGLYHGNYGLSLRGSPDPSGIHGWTASGSHPSVAAGRLSYWLDLSGPSLAVDTACSSSLVAVHLAMRSLQDGECNQAIAGGVHLLTSPEPLVASTKLGATSPDGRCKAFDAAADGFGHGEGCGVVVLKRWSDAVRDGDTVHAILRGSCVNQDGRSSSLTAPNGPAQEAAVRTALARAGIPPRLVGYVEAHGTGTSLGDPIEVEALAAALAEDRRAPLWLGSIKTNVGHLEAAAGIAGLIKAILCVEHGVLPAHLHFQTLNPKIDVGGFPLAIPRTTQAWEGIEGRRIAGVSAFGFSGTNAHVVVEAPPKAATPAPSPLHPSHTLALSARTPQALATLSAAWVRWIDATSPTAADAAFTAGAGRAHHPHRLAVVGHDAASLAAALRAATPSHAPRPPRIAFLFTGQGSQYPGMAARAYATQPVFRAALERHARVLDKVLGQPALPLLLGNVDIDATALAQPLVVALELALAEQWRAWGIEPSAVMGHSVGEYAAAAVAGIFSDEEALNLVAERGRLMQALPPGGGMLAVSASASRIHPLLSHGGASLSIAALNGPANTVISGERAALERLADALRAQGLRCAPLAVSHAFHSALLDPMLGDLEQAAASLPNRTPRIPIISNLTGKSETRFDPTYWRNHARQPVRFQSGLESLVALGCDTFLEIGPHAVLAPLGAASHPNARFVPSLRRGTPADEGLAQAIASLYRTGASIRWNQIGTGARHQSSAPTYPFEREEFWSAVPDPRPPSTPASTSSAPAAVPSPATQVAVVYDFYDELTVISREEDEGNLSFGFLPAPVPGFSWVRALFEKDERNPVRELFRTSQQELKDTVFTGIDFSRMHRVLDFGCGHAADLARLAVRHPHLRLEGFTVSARQVEVGHRRLSRLGVADRVRLHRSDSSEVPFPGTFDLIFGIEVTGLIANKEGLFNNIADHLAPGGMVAIADFVSTGDPIVNPGTNSFTPGVAQWVELLSARRLRLVRAIDASDDVADWLVEPDFERSIDDLVTRFNLGALTRRHLLSNGNIGKALRHGVMRYVLFTAQHSPHETEQALREANESTLKHPVRYRDLTAGKVSQTWRPWLFQIDWSPAEVPIRPPGPRDIAARLATSVHRERDALKPLDPLGAVLDRISIAYMARAFRDLGSTSLEDAARTPVAPSMVRLRDHWVGVLSQVRGLDVAASSSIDANALADQALLAHPEANAELTLLRRCGPHLAEALTGRVEPLDLLFPEGDATLAEALYEHSPFSKAVQRLASEVVASLPRERPLAVVEIGAGTGATTSHVLPELPPGSRYLFTDVSGSLIARAREKFSRQPLAFAPLDISRPPSAQGIATGAWDVAVAANVLHATPDLAQSLAHVRDLIVPGGLLVLIENTGRLLWGDLTFGLTPGMWNFTDTALRNHALLYQAQWNGLLEQAGFEDVSILSPGEPDRGGVSQQCVILARRSPTRHWLLTGGDEPFRQALAVALRHHGHSCRLGTLSSDIPEGITDVAVLPSPSQADPGNPQPFLEPILTLAKSATARTETPRITLVTQGAYVIDPKRSDPRTHPTPTPTPVPRSLAQSMLTGLARTVAAELPETRARLVDLDPDADASSQAGTLASELTHGHDGEVAWRSGRQLHPSLRPKALTPGPALEFDPKATYIVTGAFGGIGLELLPWMAAHGARKLVLAVRREAPPHARDILASLQASGVDVLIQTCDVARATDVDRLVAAAQARGPLKGVLHAAGVVSDAAIGRQDWSRFETVLDAKVRGTLHLHAATASLALDHFVLFASAAALLGPSGQANHASVNEFLGAFAAWRRSRGWAALAVDWGAWAEVGAVTHGQIQAHVGRTGLRLMPPAQALSALAHTMTAGTERLAIVDADWHQYGQRFPVGGVPVLLRHLTTPPTSNRSTPHPPHPASPSVQPGRAGPSRNDAASLRQRLSDAMPPERSDLLRDAIRVEAARIMGLEDPASIEDARPLRDLGLDSLMSVELRNALVLRGGAKLPATLLFDHPSIEALAAELSRIAFADLMVPAPSRASNSPDNLDALDADALSTLLAEELRVAGTGGGTP